MLRIAEHFYSIQGEGVTMGVPSVFLRLAGCNLLCGGDGTIQDKELHGGATWRCDTIEVWMRGKKISDDALFGLCLQMGYIEHFRNGVHLVVTGGEPMQQADELISFFTMLPPETLIEVETNGTIEPRGGILKHVAQFNVSPKLRNSGMPIHRRICPDALEQFVATGRAWFKFVVSDRSDIDEVIGLIEAHALPTEQIILMPACSKRDVLRSLLPEIAEVCKQRRWRLSSRLQLELWDQTTGV